MTSESEVSVPTEGGPNKERLKLWVEALRSGEYAQATGVLYQTPIDAYTDLDDSTDYPAVPEGYCCLGVACDVAFKNGFMYEDVEWWKEGATLPDEVAKWYGLDDFDEGNPAVSGQLTNENVGEGTLPYTRAVFANDELGWDFNKIADEATAYYGLDSE